MCRCPQLHTHPVPPHLPPPAQSSICATLRRQLADEAGLTLKERGDSGDDGGLFAIWDGSQFVFEESQWGLLTAFRLWWRYGFSYWMVRS